MQLDILVAGGTVIDGTGAPRVQADVGIRDGRVVELGRVTTPAKRMIKAEGAIVTPGFVDMHTHYDAQALWDSELVASARNGVTTAVMGNCGVGCAPYTPAIQGWVKALLEGVEDIPQATLDAALAWNWDSFGAYLNRVEERPHTVNLAANVAHAPIRMIAMGERSLDGSLPTDDEIRHMEAMLHEALSAGASAFSTDRIELHTLSSGERAPEARAPREEVMALTKVLAQFSGRPIQFASDYGMIGTEADTKSELDLLREVAATGVPIFTPLQQYPVEGGWRRLVAEIKEMTEAGAKISYEAGTRAIGVLMSLEALIHPFTRHPSYMAIAHLPVDERVAAMRTSEFRTKLLSESPVFGDNDDRIRRRFESMYRDADKMFLMGRRDDYEPDPAGSIKATAEREGRTLEEVFYDALTGGDGRQFLYLPIANFAGGTLDDQHAMLSLPNTLFSFGDAGAHMAQICDAAYSSFALTHWGRDRKVGIQLESIIHKMTGAQASLFGFKDRGTIQLGSIADINVIDHANLKLEAVEMLADMPGGGQRLMQYATGYRATLVGGIPIVENDVLTGTQPGALLRSH